LFKVIHIYTLSLNDKLRDYPLLQVFSELDPSKKDAWLETRHSQMLLKAKGSYPNDPEHLFNASSCFHSFFKKK